MPMSGVFGCPKTTDKLTSEYLPQISREMILTRSLNEIRDSLHHLDLFRTFLLVSQFSPLDDFTHHETSRNHPRLQKKLPPLKTNEYPLKIAAWKMRGCPFKTVPVQEDFNSLVFEQKRRRFRPPHFFGTRLRGISQVCCHLCCQGVHERTSIKSFSCHRQDACTHRLEELFG